MIQNKPQKHQKTPLSKEEIEEIVRINEIKLKKAKKSLENKTNYRSS